jgi:hypothetical protein
MAATITFYNSFREYVADGSIDLDADTFKVQLHTSTHVPAVSDTQLSDLDNEHSNGNGYTTGGEALAGVSWSHSGATATFDANDTVWTASGGSITARYAIIYDDTSTNDLLVAYILLDDTPADVTATDGNTLTLAWNASGIFTIT